MKIGKFRGNRSNWGNFPRSPKNVSKIVGESETVGMHPVIFWTIIPADDIFSFKRQIYEQNNLMILRNLDNMASVWPMLTMSAPAYNGQRVRGTKTLWSWRHFLISENYFLTKLSAEWVRMTVWLTEWLNGLITGWMIDWMADWLNEWLNDRLNGWMTGRMNGWMA